MLMGLCKSGRLSTMPDSAYDLMTLAELIHNVPVSGETVELYNNIGFFLGHKEQSQWGALYVLDEVIKGVPERTPAYLNIADVLYDEGDPLGMIRARGVWSVSRADEPCRQGSANPRRVWDRLRGECP